LKEPKGLFKMRKSFVKRISKIERVTYQPRWRLVVKDDDGLYRGECGEGLSEEQFEVWVKQQDSDTQVIIVEVAWPEDSSDGNSVTFKVENHADRNGLDLLKQY
jgi:hypothetical protein